MKYHFQKSKSDVMAEEKSSTTTRSTQPKQLAAGISSVTNERAVSLYFVRFSNLFFILFYIVRIVLVYVDYIVLVFFFTFICAEDCFFIHAAASNRVLLVFAVSHAWFDVQLVYIDQIDYKWMYYIPN